MIHLNIEKKYQDLNFGKILAPAAEATLEEAAHTGYELSLALVGDAEIQRLNTQFLGEDYATDVLSFPAGEGKSNYLGDVVISVPRAAAQAKFGGHRLEEELQLLAVHGVLHLVGYDHETPEEKDRMWAIQSGVLDRLGVGISTSPAEQPI
jgi:probable rRNA maturation factor